MTQEVTIETLSLEQLRELVLHQSQCEEIMKLINATLLLELGQLTHEPGSVSCNAVREKLNQWSEAVNELTEASSAESFQIIGIDLKTYN